jgi:hypothetical protein
MREFWAMIELFCVFILMVVIPLYAVIQTVYNAVAKVATFTVHKLYPTNTD